MCNFSRLVRRKFTDSWTCSLSMRISIGRCISRTLRSWRIFGLTGRITLSNGSGSEICSSTKSLHGGFCRVWGFSMVKSALGVLYSSEVCLKASEKILICKDCAVSRCSVIERMALIIYKSALLLLTIPSPKSRTTPSILIDTLAGRSLQKSSAVHTWVLRANLEFPVSRLHAFSIQIAYALLRERVDHPLAQRIPF